ncbi:ABC transporter permease subunit [Archaeoglobus veneficus]|uniref:Uncharacterized protein n=1 Tax=Archaeoglobus veneficus (strain DSM 11195 / SNP6) TaxID=693661 RepID=F2KNY5_ARCVS|nr:ABC transporter permease subunit [Archaeoglobus veneficus]AEA46293.1 hypothetical protein Arcve_0257 [Archaeoglobus veneficus SNP6]
MNINERIRPIVKKEWLLFRREGAVKWILIGLLLTLGLQVIYILNDVETSKVVGAFMSMLLAFGFITTASPLIVAGEKESGTLEVLLTEATSREVFWSKVLFVSIIPLLITTISFIIALLTMVFTGIWLEAIVFYASVCLTILTLAITGVIASAKSKSIMEAYQLSRQTFILPAIPMTAVMLAMLNAPNLIAIPFILQIALFVGIYKIGVRKFEDVERLVYS